MIVLWILLALLLLFLLLLFSPITFLLRWKDELQVKVRFLFVTIDVMKRIRKGDKKKKRKKKIKRKILPLRKIRQQRKKVRPKFYPSP